MPTGRKTTFATMESSVAAAHPTPIRRARARERKQSHPLISAFYAVFPLLVAAGVLFVLVIIGGKAIQGYEMRQEAKTLERRIDDLRKENRQLGQELEYYKSDDYIEKVAREELGLVRPGDVSIVVAGAEGVRGPSLTLGTTAGAGQSRTPAPIWQRWLAVFLDQG